MVVQLVLVCSLAQAARSSLVAQLPFSLAS